MSNIIPPLISDTPPPPPCLDEEEDDEFGNFVGTNDLSYGCENFSLPTTPEHSPKKESIPSEININSYKDKSLPESNEQKLDVNKDHYDRRKSDTNEFPLNILPNNFINKDSKHKPLNDYYHCSDEKIATLDYVQEISDITKVPFHKKTEEVCPKSEFHNNIADVLNINEEKIEIQDKFSIHCDDHLKPKGELEIETEIILNGDLEIGNYIESTSDSQETDNLAFDDAIEDDINESLNISNYLDDPEQWSEGIDTDLSFGDFTANIEKEEENVNQQLDMNVLSVISQVLDNPDSDNLLNREYNFVKCDDDNFADFSGFISSENYTVVPSTSINFPISNENIALPEDDEFDDFGDFVSNYNTSELTPSILNDSDDSFGDFQGTSTITDAVLILPENPLGKAQKLFEETFPNLLNDVSEYVYDELEKDDHIFQLLQDVTDTPGLTYQWPKSSSQKLLLKALNIDERNILPPWNPSMPIFASNLSLQPLEPIKSEVSSPNVPSLSPLMSTKSISAEIPSAQFDWKGSGLENPLENIPSEDNSRNSPCSLKDLDDWEIWMKTGLQEVVLPQIDPSLTNELSDNLEKPQQDIPIKPELESKTPDFNITAINSTHIPQQWTNTTPLRETHISNQNIDISHDIWMDPLGVLSIPQTYISSSNESVTKIETTEISGDDDFDDFQTASAAPTLEWSQQIVPSTAINNISISNDIANDTEWFPDQISDLHSATVSSKQDENDEFINTIKQDISEKSITTEDDEFTDFQSSSPLSKVDPARQLKPSGTTTLEPLKPVPVYQAQNLNPTQINWPDPGVTDDEIKKFEEIFSNKSTLDKLPKDESRHVLSQESSSSTEWSDFVGGKSNSDSSTNILPSLVNSSNMQPKIEENTSHINKRRSSENSSHVIVTRKTENPQPTYKSKTLSKCKTVRSTEDDEWSEFVSAQKPSPVHKVVVRESERTSSPDLPLSVFNLGSIQPTKQPIPVITPQGLVQTKLSANMVNNSPKSQQKNLKQYLQPVQMMPMMTPSIISNQYVSQAYGLNLGTPPQQSIANQGAQSQGDDEWGDFVSSPPPPQQTINGYRQQISWQDPNPQSSWTKSSPNIITNPRHYIQSASDVNKRVSSVTTKRNMVPNLVLPELDFVAPKNRIPVNKKK